jgi:activating signal cointegrator 1
MARTLMHALSLSQPWASLMADGRKCVETRSWPAPQWLLGNRLAIHAAKSIDKKACQKFGYDPEKIPRGVILCHVHLHACLELPTTPARIVLAQGRLMNPVEIQYGNFDAGRYAWLCSDVQPVDPPIPAKGHLSIWNCFLDVPVRLDVKVPL